MLRSLFSPAALLGFACLGFLTACGGDGPDWARSSGPYVGNTGRAMYSESSQPPDSVSYWDGDNVGTGPARIEVRLREQRAYFYKGDVLVGLSAISSGKEGLNTPTGTYKVIQMDKDHRSSLFGKYVDATTGAVINDDVDTSKDKKPPGARYEGTPMPNFLRVVGGVGMHAGFLPGVPASHGCIRMVPFMSEHFFRNAKLGTPVSIIDA